MIRLRRERGPRYTRALGLTLTRGPSREFHLSIDLWWWSLHVHRRDRARAARPRRPPPRTGRLMPRHNHPRRRTWVPAGMKPKNRKRPRGWHRGPSRDRDLARALEQLDQAERAA